MSATNNRVSLGGAGSRTRFPVIVSLPAVLGFVILFLTGCSGINPCLSKSASLPKGHSAVFGAVRLTSGFQNPVSIPVLRSTRLSVVDGDTSAFLFDHQLHDPESLFCWHLSPGNYAIAELVTSVLGNQRYTKYRVWAEFSVASPGQLVYIGNLNLSVTQQGLRTAVMDNYSSTLEEFRSAYPNVIGDTTKSLMKLEERK